MTLKKQNGFLFLVGLQGACYEVVKSSQLLKIFQLKSTVEQAVQELSTT